MKVRKILSGILGSGAMCMLILDSKTAMAGAADGMELCIRSLIPALFPFLVVSPVLTGALSGSSVSLLVVGFLGGYPVGARNVSGYYRNGTLPRHEAERMLAFCSNAGPAFLFGIIGPMFSQWYIPWLLWLIHILGALTAGVIAVPRWPRGHNEHHVSLPDALRSAVGTMGMICGWVMLFRIIIAFLEKWCFWAMPDAAQVLISGLLELSNGCVRLGQIELPGLRYLISGVMLALGGCCVTMQTVSVCDGLSLRWYVPGKIIQCAVSILLCLATQFVFPAGDRVFLPGIAVLSMAVLIPAAFLLGRSEKSSSKIAAIGV